MFHPHPHHKPTLFIYLVQITQNHTLEKNKLGINYITKSVHYENIFYNQWRAVAI